MSILPPGLPLPELEQTYDALAEHLDRVPEGKTELFLVKLALLLANEVGSAARVHQHLAAALRDL